ncbi:MAG: site-specific integrase [Erysipelotrichaceae bacterium]|nr:site-specific integrase [Erysipelotrichaceae bacterium]
MKKPNILFADYYKNWISIFKKGAVRNVTLKKYLLTLEWIKKIAPKIKLRDIDRISYQELLNHYALSHERQTVMDFHHQLKSAILDAVEEGLIANDPTRKIIIKGKTPHGKKPKFLNQFELHNLLSTLHLGDMPDADWLIMLIAKTGMRFSEAIAVTPNDFDFCHQTLIINKTWDYKEKCMFQPTKNKSSERKIQIDWMTASQFSKLVINLNPEKPIFFKNKIFNSTINDRLAKRCKEAGIPQITLHGLRHTHASMLLFGGVSIASVAKRLGHSTMTTTEKVYLHIIRELENKDVDLVMRSLSNLN